MLTSHQQEFYEIFGSDRVWGWNKDLIEGYFDINLVLFDGFKPWDPFPRGDIELIVIDEFFSWEVSDTNFWNDGSEPLVKLLSSYQVGCATNRPDSSKQVELRSHAQVLLYLFVGDFLDLSFNVIGQVAVHDSEQTLDDIIVASNDWFHYIVSEEVATIFQNDITKELKFLSHSWVLFNSWWKGVEPRGEVWLKTD